jgi:hypothetical protein
MATPRRASRTASSDVRQAHKTAMAAQSALHLSMLDLLRQMGDFTLSNLTRHLTRTNPRVPQPTINRFVDETIEQFQGLLDRNGGYYRVKPDVPLTREATMQSLRNLATKPAYPEVD